MPTYSFECGCGHFESEFRTIADRDKPKKCIACGKKMLRDWIADARGTAHAPGAWPLVSEAAGVMPAQAASHQAQIEKLKISGVRVIQSGENTGCVEFSSRRARKEYCERYGMYDKSGGYGDPQRK